MFDVECSMFDVKVIYAAYCLLPTAYRLVLNQRPGLLHIAHQLDVAAIETHKAFDGQIGCLHREKIDVVRSKIDPSGRLGFAPGHFLTATSHTRFLIGHDYCLFPSFLLFSYSDSMYSFQV